MIWWNTIRPFTGLTTLCADSVRFESLGTGKILLDRYLSQVIGFESGCDPADTEIAGFLNFNLLKGVVVKRILLTLMIFLIPLGFVGTTATDAKAGLGLGVHYLETLGDIKDNPDYDSSSWGFLAAYSFGPGLINFEVDVEWIPDYAFGKNMVEPSAFVFVGGFIYGGLGIGIGHINGDWQSDPFYAIRAGVKFAMLDVFTSYRFQKWSDIDGSSDDWDTITFGAMFKF